MTIRGRVANLAGGPLIDAVGAGPVDLTVEHVFAVGGDRPETSGRFVQAFDFKSVTIRNTTIENTRGIELTWGIAGSRVLITRNRMRNIQGNVLNPVGNFVQLREVQNAAVVISWNEVVNQYDRSNPEDIISLYHTSNARVSDNMLWHQSTPGNPRNRSSQGGITVDCSDPGTFLCNNNWIVRNQVVDGMGIVVSAIHGGDNNLLLQNRVVNDGKLPDGTRIGNGWLGMSVVPGGSNNHAHRNVIGYVNKDALRRDALWHGSPEGHAAERTNNTTLRRPVTSASERREWVRWQRKLGTKRIRIGV